jgi:NAD(P)-dependent dehydrogenase (short-subunit alcohol dehydrogenase family)
MTLGQLKDKVAIITGGGTGIGRAIAETLAREGASTALIGPDTAVLDEARADFGDKGLEAYAYVADVRVRDQVDKAVSECVAHLGSVDILVNNAGLFPNKSAVDMTEDDWDTVIDTNLKGTFLVSQACARHMIEQGTGGRIVNISSTAAKIARPGIAHYGSSKAGISHMTAVLAIEWGPMGITVNCVAPGIVLTEQVQKQMSSPEGHAEYESRRSRIPLGRFGDVNDVAQAVRWLVSDHASYCTGVVLTIDGGYSLGVASYT